MSFENYPPRRPEDEGQAGRRPRTGDFTEELPSPRTPDTQATRFGGPAEDPRRAPQNPTAPLPGPGDRSRPQDGPPTAPGGQQVLGQPGPGVQPGYPQAGEAYPSAPGSQPPAPGAYQQAGAPHHQPAPAPWDMPRQEQQPAAFGGPSGPYSPQQTAATAAPRRKGRGGLVAGTLTGALLLSLLGGAGGAYAYDHWLKDEPGTTSVATGGASTGPQQSVDRPDGSVQSVAAKALPAVVTIRGKSSSESWSGSGFIYTSDGYIITNAHVAVAGQDNAQLQVELADGQILPATVKGADKAYDIAVIKIDKNDLPTLKMADSDKAVIGDPVIAIGSPFRLTETVTTGIISAKDRPVASSDGSSNADSYISAIQTDAAINPGNSGGPLLDMNGQVVGINSAGKSVPNQQSGFNIGLGFAIPANQAKKTADELIKTGKATHPIIGASFDTSYDGGDGAKILDDDRAIVKDGPADKGGLQKGDLITTVDGKKVTTLVEMVVAIRSKDVGDTIKVGYQRGDKTGEANVTLQGKESE